LVGEFVGKLVGPEVGARVFGLGVGKRVGLVGEFVGKLVTLVDVGELVGTFVGF
jgi:hypothetical protein